jgi:hypothetical protein
MRITRSLLVPTSSRSGSFRSAVRWGDLRSHYEHLSAPDQRLFFDLPPLDFVVFPDPEDLLLDVLLLLPVDFDFVLGFGFAFTVGLGVFFEVLPDLVVGLIFPADDLDRLLIFDSVVEPVRVELRPPLQMREPLLRGTTGFTVVREDASRVVPLTEPDLIDSLDPVFLLVCVGLTAGFLTASPFTALRSMRIPGRFEGLVSVFLIVRSRRLVSALVSRYLVPAVVVRVLVEGTTFRAFMSLTILLLGLAVFTMPSGFLYLTLSAVRLYRTSLEIGRYRR